MKPNELDALRCKLQYSLTMARRKSIHVSHCKRTVFFSPQYFNIVANEKLKPLIAKKCKDQIRNGYHYFITDQIYFNEDASAWSSTPTTNDDIEGNINIVDKNKVWSIKMAMCNAGAQLFMNGCKGVEELSSNSNHRHGKRFLHEVYQAAKPKATLTRFITVATDTSLVLNAGIKTKPCGQKVFNHGDVNVNMANINMGKGIYQCIMFMYVMAKKLRANNPHTLVFPCMQPHINNNNITVDSVISSVRNEVTVTDRLSGASGGILHVLSKNSFKTKKIVCAIDTKQTKTYHKIKGIVPTSGVEIQVHPRSFNSSSVSGHQLMPMMKEICVRMLNNKKINVDVCLYMCKTLNEKLADSICCPLANDFAERLCESYGTFEMPVKEQYRIFKDKCKPLLESLTWSRETYAQYTYMSNHHTLGRYLDFEDQEQVSAKYAKNKYTRKIFATNTTHTSCSEPATTERKCKKRKLTDGDNAIINISKRRRTVGLCGNLFNGIKQFKDNYDLPLPKPFEF